MYAFGKLLYNRLLGQVIADRLVTAFSTSALSPRRVLT
jgi:hypothetical protein